MDVLIGPKQDFGTTKIFVTVLVQTVHQGNPLELWLDHLSSPVCLAFFVKLLSGHWAIQNLSVSNGNGNLRQTYTFYVKDLRHGEH